MYFAFSHEMGLQLHIMLHTNNPCIAITNVQIATGLNCKYAMLGPSFT